MRQFLTKICFPQDLTGKSSSSSSSSSSDPRSFDLPSHDKIPKDTLFGDCRNNNSHKKTIKINNRSTASSQGHKNDDSIEVLEVKGNGSFNLPHARSDCTQHKFSSAEANRYHSASVPLSALINAKHCEKCYCYVCDDLASKCLEWRVHCHGE